MYTMPLPMDHYGYPAIWRATVPTIIPVLQFRIPIIEVRSAPLTDLCMRATFASQALGISPLSDPPLWLFKQFQTLLPVVLLRIPLQEALNLRKISSVSILRPAAVAHIAAHNAQQEDISTPSLSPSHNDSREASPVIIPTVFRIRRSNSAPLLSG
jgi:hypothetical protein